MLYQCICGVDMVKGGAVSVYMWCGYGEGKRERMKVSISGAESKTALMPDSQDSHSEE